MTALLVALERAGGPEKGHSTRTAILVALKRVVNNDCFTCGSGKSHSTRTAITGGSEKNRLTTTAITMALKRADTKTCKQYAAATQQAR